MDTKVVTTREVKADAQTGEFEALVSSFNKPDKYGDIVRPGAFADTIARWRAKGAMVPVVFAHQSADPDSHIGEVDPTDLHETAVGLVAQGRLYLTEARAAKVHRQLVRKTLTQWSFAFRIAKAKPLAEGGGRELLSLDLFELGPCLVGVGDTETIAVKSDAGVRDTRDTRDPHAADRLRVELAQRRTDFALRVARRL